MFAKDENSVLFLELGFRRDVNCQVTVEAYPENVDMIIAADVELTDGMSCPHGRHGDFVDAVAIAQRKVVEQVAASIAHSRP